MIFLGCLPRSGSTLLVSLLQQNPDLDVHANSWIVEAIDGIRQAYALEDCRKAALDQGKEEERLINACREMVKGYGADVCKTRTHFSSLPFIKKVLGEDFKIIAPVRDLAGILASMETKYRKSPETYFDPDPGTIVERAKLWSKSYTLPLGTPLHALRETIEVGDVSNILFVRYENLISDPMGQLEIIYKWCGWDWDARLHDPDNLETKTSQHDPLYGCFGDHTLTSHKVENNIRQPEETLGRELVNQIRKNHKWFYEALYGVNLK